MTPIHLSRRRPRKWRLDLLANNLFAFKESSHRRASRHPSFNFSAHFSVANRWLSGKNFWPSTKSSQAAVPLKKWTKSMTRIFPSSPRARTSRNDFHCLDSNAGPPTGGGIRSKWGGGRQQKGRLSSLFSLLAQRSYTHTFIWIHTRVYIGEKIGSVQK